MSVDDFEALHGNAALLKKLTTTTVVCEHEKPLLRVITYSGERMVVFDEPEVRVDTQVRSVDHRAAQVFAYLDGAEPGAWLTASNDCCSRRIEVEWLLPYADAATRRVRSA